MDLVPNRGVGQQTQNLITYLGERGILIARDPGRNLEQKGTNSYYYAHNDVAWEAGSVYKWGTSREVAQLDEKCSTTPRIFYTKNV